MLARRNFLKQILRGSFAFWGGLSLFARAGTAGTHDNSVLASENCSYLGEVRRKLYRKIVTGEAPDDASESVRCPLCGQAVKVTARDALAYCTETGLSA